MQSFFVAIDGRWLSTYPKYERRIGEQKLLPLGESVGVLRNGANVLVKFRDAQDRLVADGDGQVSFLKDLPFLKCRLLCSHLFNHRQQAASLLLFFEGTDTEARCIVRPNVDEVWEELVQDDPTLRLEAYQLPPREATVIEAERLVELVHAHVSKGDPELFAIQADQFLEAPHILVPLFAHVMGLSSREQIDFPIRLKKLADQLRTLLTEHTEASVRIAEVQRDHPAAWREVNGLKVSFLDGGAARIAGLPGSEPSAMRVGVYTVRPGIRDPAVREEWALLPYVVGDIVEVPAEVRPRDGESTDKKRLQEAARYVLEPLTALRHLQGQGDTRILFVHGPLVNQFLQYDEGEPNFVPCLAPSFLASVDITKEKIERTVQDIPTVSGRLLWNQFMAVYGYVMNALFSLEKPVVGVVERSAGRWLVLAVLDRLVRDGLVTESYNVKVRAVLNQYDISDDFLFGCILREGEYITPIRIAKNLPRRARERWQLVVQQYPQPWASVLKTAEGTFPYRVEMNKAAGERESQFVFRLLYHTSRLLPTYAFPVGLDIVDKYAKVPDWISRGVSARLSAEVLRRALRTGDPHLVSQVRQFLARTPRDFFFRPGA